MLSVRIIPCLDVKNGFVVKGVQFQNHRKMGSIEDNVRFYQETGADELVFYDILASCENRCVDLAWVSRVSSLLSIPFCVAGGIKTVRDAKAVFNHGADKISINSPALERPQLLRELADEFGSQSIVVGIDSFFLDNDYRVYQYTGSEDKKQNTGRKTLEWVEEVQLLGAGELVLNCMNQDGLRNGYDIAQLQAVKKVTRIPLIASGGAGCEEDFLKAFVHAGVEGALAASVFHERTLHITDLKEYLAKQDVVVRL